MRVATRSCSLLLACGLASSAHAEPLAPLSRTDTRVQRDRGEQGAAPRAYDFRGQFASMRDELEHYPAGVTLATPGASALPTSTIVPDGFDWGMNNLRGQANVNYVSIVDLAGSPVGGNATQSLRIRTHNAQTPGYFYTGGSLRWDTSISPSPDQNARVSAELFISTIAEQYTFEPISGIAGFIAGRLLWGGTCVDLSTGYCAELGLPLGPVPTLHALFDNGGFSTGSFYPVRFCTNIAGQPIPGCTPPPGFTAGDFVPPPIGAWARFTAQIGSDGRLTYFIDYLNGEPEVAIANQNPFQGRINRLGWNTSFESQDAFMLVDNIEASGTLSQVFSPPPLECPYFDDLKWLSAGLLSGQTPRWIVDLTAAPRVLNDGAQGRFIQEINTAANDRYRQQMRTQLPVVSTTLTNDVVASVRVRTTGSTVRAFALLHNNDVAARAFINLSPPGSASFDNGVFVQINPAYDPIDPFLSGPVDANNPVLDTDIVDTGFDWTPDADRRLEMRLSANGVLRVSIDGQRIYTGPGAFTHGVDFFASESENNNLGAGSVLQISDIAVTCDAPSCATDFDFDDLTSFSDLNAVLSNFGATGLTGFTPGDANADGVVNFTDLNAVLAAFGSSCH